MSADLQRWRLILGPAAERSTGGLNAENAGRDAALDWLYGRDDDLGKRDVRRGGARDSDDRRGGDEASIVTTVDWLDSIHKLFPKDTIERLERDAIERYQIHDVLTDPDVLARIEPNPALLKAVLQTKHLMNPAVLNAARRIVEEVVRQLVEKLSVQVRTVFTGSRNRKPSFHRRARDFDLKRTLKSNLKHYRPEDRQVAIERPHFHSRTSKRLEQWQLVLLVDQSGSMTSSVIHSAVTAACLYALPGLKTHLVAFDTSVVDMTSEVDDPVELLMKVQLGGGTDIAKAVDYAAGLIENPRRSIVALITDFYEGGSESRLVHTTKQLCEQGTQFLGLAALDEEANPSYDRNLAKRMADVGAHIGAMTPSHLVEFVAERLGT
ncbi:VWA domain containing CoxE-like protein [Glycomyces sambucus]|uniref:VWA domain containing CoxE-like protein n=1 Tax=Glycomyces sambucus TaxID=380244 RepID=A0A1G9IK53_9ACTN|nr:VWA domain-containing protein [Glycomyces sambucus]SDL25234.1 VWA domain containing CoxE-like protein [Glycomyces sambucus]